MATTGSGSGSSLPPNFFLTPQQQNLLFTALNANKQQQSNAKPGLSLSPTSFKSNPLQSLDGAGFQESPFLDNYDYDFGDSSFDFSFASDAAQANMIGDVPDSAMSAKSDSTETDSPEKRSHPDDEDDDASPGNESKRHEGSDKVPKKPGRKPLTSEPTSKRKAQNRAAQRAFRERKEKHLKDLETKVEELEKASEATNHENSMLRAQVERITAELNHYKQRMTLVSPKSSTQTRAPPFGSAAINNINDVSFQFEFPKFGTLPGPVSKATHQKSMSQPISPSSHQSSSPAASQKNVEKASPFSQQAARNAQFKEDLAKFNNGVFNMHTPSMSSSTATGSRASVDSANYSLNNATSSPSASSHSNVGASSSCGTSPEPFTQSPMGFKPVDTLTTIGEEHPSMSTTDGPFSQFAGLDFNNNSFDWLVQQNNGGQFDPQLFGDYREPQENVMTHSTFDDLFNDSVEADFFTPYNIAASPNLAQPKKANLIDEIDAKQNAVDDEPSTSKQNMSCNQLWERLQACPKAQNGEFDLDGLCSELTKKAKCSGSGPVVAERDFDSILKKYMGKEAAECTAEKLGISLDKVKSEPLVMP
ncbi:bzip transcription factor ap-1 [Trichoderma arundinaceum]|uniref:Bzip transcription factor ap-1 n=1 Tax=Trichoderma arundinaceum TaxID=490622 RepID=A0A395NQF7_TRIAR|nr:bzip transcription factor ap-1 [Trichoderma arundinaceum]